MGVLVDVVKALRGAVEGEMLPLMLDVGQAVAQDAQSGHPWRNRTGRLERSIRHGSVSGSLSHGYRVTVSANMPYASFLEYGWDTGYSISGGSVSVTSSQWAFLWPAWERREDWAAQHIERGLADAINRA